MRPADPWASPEGLLALHIIFLAERGDLLALEARRRLHDHVVTYPGLHLREIARAVEMSPNHAKYHLTYLERHGLLSSRKEGGYWRFYPRQESQSVGMMRDVVGRQEKAVLAFLRRPVPLHATLVLLDRGEGSLVELSEAVRVSPSTLHYHLAKMEREGVVASTKEGRERRYRLNEPQRLLDLLLRFRPPDALVQGFLEAWEQLELP